MMLEMDGVTVIREAQKCRPGMPAILPAGFIGNVADIAVEGALSGALRILQGPVKGDVPLSGIAAALLDAAPA